MPTIRPIAPAITKAASRQTYYTIRFLADRERAEDAYRAYAYFRWVDDTLDADAGEVDARNRLVFLARQKSLLERCRRSEPIEDAAPEETMLIELVRYEPGKHSGLHSYIRYMMKVMEFDAARRGRLISQAELSEYTRWLASAVTEAMHYSIGHNCSSPHDDSRYLAVTGAHITHMLRDTFDDLQTGYYNIPREVLEAGRIQPHEIHSPAYRAWVRDRVQLARQCFQAGRRYLARVENTRCRLAGFAYTARFEWLLDTIAREDYLLRPQYTERKSLGTGLRMGIATLSALLRWRRSQARPQPVISQLLKKL